MDVCRSKMDITRINSGCDQIPAVKMAVMLLLHSENGITWKPCEGFSQAVVYVLFGKMDTLMSDE